LKKPSQAELAYCETLNGYADVITNKVAVGKMDDQKSTQHYEKIGQWMKNFSQKQSEVTQWT
jgi:hypothetical protein